MNAFTSRWDSRTRRILAASICLAALLTSSPSRKRGGQPGDAASVFGRLPLAFEANQGQFSGETRFVSRANGLVVILTDRTAIFRLGPSAPSGPGGRSHLRNDEPAHTATLRFPGAAPRKPEGEARLPGVANYLIGNNPSQWRTGVSGYERVRYSEIYPGIDLVYHGNGRNLEYDFVVAPHAKASNIALAFSGVSGLKIDDRGDLAVQMGERTLIQRRPVAYQEIGGRRHPVEARYLLAEGRPDLGISVGSYDPSRPLVIDPVLDYSVFFGGSGVEGANYVAVDSAGNAYITGGTTSNNLFVSSPATGRLQGSSDAFVAKLNPSGTALVYTTYLGGAGAEIGTSLTVNGSGVVYVCGVTNSPDFPTAGAGQFPRGGGSEDGFLSILNGSGAGLINSTYFGGSGDDIPNAIAIDAASNVFLAGYSDSPSIPGLATFSPQSRNAGGYDAFVAKFSSSGSLLFSTFYGGSGDESANAIAIGSAGEALVVGGSDSPTLPGGASGNRASGNACYIFRINSSGTSFTASRFFGGSRDQAPFAISIDRFGSIYVTGMTNSSDFPVNPEAEQTSLRGDYDAFVTILLPSIASGSLTINYSTYLGGTGRDVGYGIVAGRNGTVYVAGYTDSGTLPPSRLPQPPAGRKSTFIVQLSVGTSGGDGPGNGTAPRFLFAAYLGAQDANNPMSLALRAASSADEIFIAGHADSTFQFPSSGGSRPVYGGGFTDAFIAKLANADVSIANVTDSNPVVPTGVTSLAFKLSNLGPSAAENVVVRISLQAGLTAVSCSARFPCTILSGGVVSITYPNLAAAESDNITLLVKASASAVNQSLSYSVALSSGTNDPNPANNAAIGSVFVGGVPPFILDPPDTLDFSTVSAGRTGQKTLTIQTTSAVDVQLVLEPQGTTAAGVFAFPAGAQTSFTVARQQGIIVTFTPDRPGDWSALLTVKAPGFAFTTTITLNGSGTAPVQSAAITQIVDGAGFQPVIAANAWVTIKGSNLATTTRTWGSSDFIGGRLPQGLEGTSVKINGISAYVYYISPVQLNVLAPRDAFLGTVTVEATTPAGIVTASAAKDQVAPGIFMNGPTYAACTLGIAVAGTNLNPVSPGQNVSLYLSGFGDTTPAYPNGVALTMLVNTVLTPSIQIGTATVVPSYSGMVGGNAGVYQINLTVPNLPAGDQPVAIRIGTRQTQPGVFLSIAR